MGRWLFNFLQAKASEHVELLAAGAGVGGVCAYSAGGAGVAIRDATSYVWVVRVKRSRQAA